MRTIQESQNERGHKLNNLRNEQQSAPAFAVREHAPKKRQQENWDLREKRVQAEV
jgi:hypothetical protein